MAIAEGKILDDLFERRFVGLAEILERHKHFENHLHKDLYCPDCDDVVSADFSGGVVSCGKVKFLTYNCSRCFSFITVRDENLQDLRKEYLR